MIDRAPGPASSAPVPAGCTYCGRPTRQGRRTCHHCSGNKAAAERRRSREAAARAAAKGLKWCPRCKREHAGPYQRCDECREAPLETDLPAQTVEQILLEGDRRTWRFPPEWRPEP